MNPRTRYLLDSNILSETRKKRADERVLTFLNSVAPGSLYLSCLSIGELEKGIALKLKTDAAAAKAIAAWAEGLETHFADRILNIDLAVSKLWGEWSAQRSRPVIDTLLAATAVLHDMVLVTRNDQDIADLPVKIMNPWHSR